MLDTEIKTHEKLLAHLTTALVPQLTEAFGLGPDTAAELPIVAGDNPSRIRSEPAFAKLCGVSPIPASSGLTSRHHLNRGGHRQTNAAIYRTVIVRMQYHEPTKTFVARRTVEGKTKTEIIPCLKQLSPANCGPRCGRSALPADRYPRPLDSYRSINALAEA